MKKCIVLLVSTLSLAASQAALIHFDLSPPGTDIAVGLVPANEVPPAVTSTGSGGEVSGGIVYDTDTGLLHLAIGYGTAASFTDLTAPATSAHIHGPTRPGTNAVVLVDLAPYHFPASDPAKGGVIVGSIPFPAAHVTNLFDGLLYVNVHTTNYMGGEIRAQLIAVIPSNSPPSLLCPSGGQVECGTPTTLTAAVSDEDGDALTVAWTLNGVPVQTNTIPAGGPPSGAMVTFTSELPRGTNTVGITVTDSATNTTSCSATVVVADTTPPVIVSASTSPRSLWPPNHKMVAIRVTARVEDACGPATWKITSVTSNEDANGNGDGNTARDWQITGDHSLQLRAERSGRGSGRIYSITIVATDQSGNTSEKVLTVNVPKSQGRQ
jgi:hypothetical protein